MSAPWKIEGDAAQLQIGPLTAQLSLPFPERGLHQVAFAGVSATDSPASFLAVLAQPVERAEQIHDCYVRGSDLVVTYSETAERDVRLQLYWRAFEFPEENSQAFGVDLITSTQTSKLYSDPTLLIASRMPAIGEPRLVAAMGDSGPIMLRLNPPAWSFAQAVHPSDFDQASAALDGDGRGEIRHQLFAPGLEKGVIRRGRLRGIFVPREQDELLVDESYAEFVKQELPLTT